MTDPLTDQMAPLMTRREVEALLDAERERIAREVESLEATTVTDTRWDSNGVMWIDDASLGTGRAMLDRAAVLAIIRGEAPR